MPFKPANVAVLDYHVARAVAMGGELKVFLHEGKGVKIGNFRFSGVAAGAWSADLPNAAVLSANPDTLVLKVEDELVSAVDVTVSVVGTDETDAALTGTATIRPIPWSDNPDRNFPEGYSVDVVVAANKKFKTVTGVTVTAGGSYGGKFSLWSLPNSSWREVGFTTDKGFTVKQRPPVNVPNGMNGSEIVLAGRSDVGSLSITSNYRSQAEGLQRFLGRVCCAKLELYKAEKLLTEVHYFNGFRPVGGPNFGDGSALATSGGQGMYEDYFCFVAE